jgi:hypothetical protein
VKLILVAAITFVVTVIPGSAAFGAGCTGVYETTCNGQVQADQPHGDFHGLIAIDGEPSVLATAAHSGTEPGCGDCTWTLVTACYNSGPLTPDPSRDCDEAARNPTCNRGVLQRLYLSDDAVQFEDAGTFCLRHHNHLIPIGDLARADVGRYLKDVTPPDLDLVTKPKDETLAGLPTYFSAAPPARLRPHPFGNGAVTETISIAPKRADWVWGDGQRSGWVAATVRETHDYVHGGTAHGSVTTRWGATYTISYEGRTFGPYDAVGLLTKRQAFRLPVDTSSPTLVSHG